MWNKAEDHLFLPHKTFLKVKKRSGTNLRLILCMIFEEKYFFVYILFPDQISLPDCHCNCNCIL